MIINNVKLVLENEVVHGSLEVQDGEIRAFAESQSRLPEAMDGEGGWLLPGLMSCIPTTSINSSPRARKSTGPPIRR
ncbi:putative amidohydrolase [Escherichia coli]|uniref:Putative amidohydrolase n=1 Tax=Escherichia coli TaxID=562 RepID=A0A377A6P6_ECOLX|nr:putative amidohydrolase [Escherichia coli]